jgi:hypothetical protein
MTPEQDDAAKTQNEWWRMRHIAMAELLKLKSETSNDFTRELVDIELERRAFAEKVKIDRRLARSALVLSLVVSAIALVVSIIALFKGVPGIS